MEPQNTVQARFADYVRPLVSRWWLILVAVIVATGGVYAYYARKPNVYTASTLVYYQDPGDPVTGTPSQASTDRTVANEATLLDSRSTAAEVASKLHYAGSPGDLLNQVSLTSKPGQDFLQLTAQAGSAQEAATIANAFAAQLVSELDGAVANRITSAIRLTQAQLTQLGGGAAAALQRANLITQLNRLQLSQRVPPTIARQVNTAVAPAAASAPKPTRNALFALIISLVGAIALCYALERFDRRLKTPDEMERAYRRPLLAVLPHAGDPSPALAGEPSLSYEFREPFRVLRTNLELETLDAPPQVIVISSAMPGEGKSTVVRNLALAFRETGKRVAVVDLDLRHPSLAPLFASSPTPGVTEVLRNEVELDDALRNVPVGVLPMDELVRAVARRGAGGNGNGEHNGNGHHPEIAVLPSGALPANPTVVLASERITALLDELRRRFDIVLIDCAPVLPVSDSVPLLRYADGALFIGRLDATTRDTAKRLLDALSRFPDLRIIGVVANDLSRGDAGAYGYGYSYGYGHEKDEQTQARGWRKRGVRRSKQTV